VIGPLNLGFRPGGRRRPEAPAQIPVLMFVRDLGLASSLPLRAGGAAAACGRRSRRVTEAAMIHRPWTATRMLVAAPAAPLLPTVTVNSRPGPGLGRGGDGRGAAAAAPSGCIHRAHRMILAVP
jgi:hypothetical protein